MDWITPTRDDLTATVSAKEIEVFGKSSDFTDAVDAILARTVSFVRGFVRAGRVRLAADAGSIPASLLAPAMDYAAFNLLSRLRRDVNASRTKKYDRACALFDKVAQGVVVPEDYGEDPSTIQPEAALATASVRAKHRLLGRHQEDGL